MTHAEALEGNTAGLLPSACAGELVPRGRYQDNQLMPDGSMRPRTVEVLRCESCLTLVSMADGRPLNAYASPPSPRPEGAKGMVRELAGAMDGRGREWTKDEVASMMPGPGRE